MLYRLSAAVFAAVLTFAATGAQALTFDQNVTNNVIFGSGNTNGGFTVAQDAGIELGLRAKLRFNGSNQPENTFNSNGDGTYTFAAGAAPGGFGFDPNSPTTPVWNFEWSINSNFDDNGKNLDQFTFLLQIDGDPTVGIDFGTIDLDPINVEFADHSIGTNATANGAGVEATLVPNNYGFLIANNNLAQNSWNYEFFNESMDGLFLPHLALFDPSVAGIYTIGLSVTGMDGDPFLTTAIDIIVAPVPVPAALPLFAGGLGLFGFLGWRRKRGSTAAI